MIANLVTEWRTRKGSSKANFARRIGVSRSYVTRLEQGRLQPSAEVMFKIASYFGATIEEVFMPSESMRNAEQPFFAQKCCLCGNVLVLRKSPTASEAPSIPLPYSPGGRGTPMDKSLVTPTAKVVARPVA